MARSARCAEPFYRWLGRLAAPIFLVSLLGVTNPAAAQDEGNQAGLVVQFGDGSVRTACVDLGLDGEGTGEELLRATGLLTLIDYSSGSGGGTVCKIDNQGCSFPAQACFCQCTLKPGDPCIYWSYFYQVDGQWRYSNQGVSGFIARNGDVQGWVWGAGSAGTGIQPPPIAFEQICSSSSPVNPPTSAGEPSSPTAAFTPSPAATATAHPPTATPLPSATPAPTESSPTRTAAPATLTSSTTPSPSATNTVTPSLAALATPTLEPTRPPIKASTTPQALSAKAESAIAAPTGDGEPFVAFPLETADETTDKTTNYLVFGVLVVVLIGGLIFMRVR